MDHEYYTTVYSWFEKCGIISSIRTHLRQSLVNALRNKESLLKNDAAPKSAKQYVYDLLIAEYLFNHNYAYTLSVFASEAPLLINFHKAAREPENGDQNSRQKLQSDYIVHTLETLGIKPEDSKGRYIISEYTNSDVSLLLCILKCAALFTYDAHSESVESKKSGTNKYTQTQRTLQTCPLDEQFLVAKKKLLRQKQDYEEQLKKREAVLKEQVVLAEEQFATLNRKLEEVQAVMNSITLKEAEMKEKMQIDAQILSEREAELAFKEKLLSQEAERLQREQDYHTRFEQDLKKLQDLCTSQQEPLHDKPIVIEVKNVQVQTDLEINVEKENKIQILTKEKQDLTNLVQEQRSRIDQISLRAIQLSRQLEEMHIAKPIAVEISTPVMQANANTVISESSSTEDILQDAKMRLTRLEEESLKADRYYYNFIGTSP
ncbi:hypothetical protein KM043_006281 [Ampulex compressa]|nr:hypothetical protein KM043_006281 [Ampulex compressa]